MTRRYRSIKWGGTRHRVPCPKAEDRRKHSPHGWVRASDLAILDCNGFPPPKPRCRWGRNSNLGCLSDTGHGGKHRRPCPDRGKHSAHSDVRPDWETHCGGRSFDLT